MLRGKHISHHFQLTDIVIFFLCKLANRNLKNNGSVSKRTHRIVVAMLNSTCALHRCYKKHLPCYNLQDSSKITGRHYRNE